MSSTLFGYTFTNYIFYHILEKKANLIFYIIFIDISIIFIVFLQKIVFAREIMQKREATLVKGSLIKIN